MISMIDNPKGCNIHHLIPHIWIMKCLYVLKTAAANKCLNETTGHFWYIWRPLAGFPVVLLTLHSHYILLVLVLWTKIIVQFMEVKASHALCGQKWFIGGNHTQTPQHYTETLEFNCKSDKEKPFLAINKLPPLLTVQHLKSCKGLKCNQLLCYFLRHITQCCC